MTNETLIEIISRGGESMQEIVSAMLAKDGSFIRREKDLSKVEFQTEIDVINHDRNRAYTDIPAEILSAISAQSGEITGLIMNLNNVHQDVADQRKSAFVGVTLQDAADAGEER